MASFFQTLSDVFSAFGAAVFVPVILFIIAKCMGVTGKKAFNTALLCAVGLTGALSRILCKLRIGCKTE